MSDATWHGADSPPTGAEGCEMCSYADGGCSFCSGRSAIEVANERSDVAGVSVVDLTEVLDFQQRLADETAADT